MSETAWLDLNFGASAGGLFLGQGWSIEADMAWAIGPMSGMSLPIPEGHGDMLLRFTVGPAVSPAIRVAQRLSLRVRDWLVGAFVLTAPRDIDVRIPAFLLEGLDTLDLRLDHPDGLIPRDVLGVDDRRELAIEFRTGSLAREPGVPSPPPAVAPVPAAPQRTLVFCTTYGDHADHWNIRYATWLKSIRTGGLRYDQILMIDDGSPMLPRWEGVDIVLDAPGARSNARAAIYRFNNNLGRQRDFFPGWFRSFGFAGEYAERCGFDKIIHVESDAALITPRIHTYFNDRKAGWTALWCPLHSMPESGIQIMAGRDIALYRAFMARPYEELRSNLIENLMPFTRVEKSFTGDRYGEIAHSIPAEADYGMQLHTGFYPHPDYLWWLK